MQKCIINRNYLINVTIQLHYLGSCFFSFHLLFLSISYEKLSINIRDTIHFYIREILLHKLKQRKIKRQYITEKEKYIDLIYLYLVNYT